jgi:hypothetical protein
MDFSNLPNDIINGYISKYLLEDKEKTINKIFNENEDVYLNMLLFGEIKKLPYVKRYDRNTYKLKNDVLEAYVNRILQGLKINNKVHSIILNFNFLPYECEMDFNNMWIQFIDKNDDLICKINRNKELHFYVKDLNKSRIRKAEIRTIFDNLQERINMKVRDYLEDLEDLEQ